MTERVSRVLLPLVLLVFVIAGCGGPVNVKYDPDEVDTLVGVSGPVVVKVAAFTDLRPEEGASVRGSRTIGKATAVVADMTTDKITISEDVTSLVERVFEEELQRFGYTVAPGEGTEGAELVLAGEVRAMSLDVKERDTVTIELAATMTEAATGRVVWSGAESLSDDRYAGVLGNTSKSIGEYLAKNLSRVVRNMLIEATTAVAAMRPPAPAAATLPAEETPVPVAAPVAVPAAPAVNAAAPATAPAVPEGSGRLVVTTDPPRAKVYLDGVYYGLSPITIDTDPGVYDLSIKLKGRDDQTERVSVREGQTTELEHAFDE